MRIRTLQSNERFHETKIAIPKLHDFIVKQIEINSNDATQGGLQRMDSSSKIPDSNYESNSSYPKVNFDYQYLSDKRTMAKNEKRRLEANIRSKMSQMMSSFSESVFVQVLVLQIHGTVIRSMIAHVDFEDGDDKFKEGVKDLITKHPNHKKVLVNICDDINELKSTKGMPPSIFVLYSVEDHTLKVLML